MSAELSEELRQILARYLALQKEEARLKEEKAELGRRLGEHMAGSELDVWHPEIDGQRLAVSRRVSTVIQYDEDLLKERLGDRYARILSPDMKKIKAHLAELEPLLEKALPTVGTPDPGKVKEAFMNGIVTKEEFNGAFAREEKVSVSVRRQGVASAVHVDEDNG